ncbi:conserved hypothetical protein [Vibrio phage 417E50-1]|nr:conserved hypothetical protein [Vibrio phage 417E50-1]
MRILFIGGHADGKFIDVNPVEFENPNDPEDFHWVYPDLFSVVTREDVTSRVLPLKADEAPPIPMQNYGIYKLSELTSKDGRTIRFYSSREMTDYEITAMLLNCYAANAGRK